MTIVVNHTLHELREGKLAIGLGLRLARTVDIAQIAKTNGFDWLFIDCEHNSMHVDTAAQISAAALAIGVTPLVRVPGYEHHHASRALDNGALGVVFPHVDTAEQARRLADYCRYPPAGRRSMGGALQQLGFASMPVGEVARIANEQTMVVVMLESPQAIENCEAIAAVPGVDALLIGTNDLCFEMGIPGQFDHTRVVDAYTRLVAACRKHGKFPGMGGVYAPELLERYIGMGVRLILAGSDFALLMQAAGARASLVRGFER
jgi:2-keto-3-deoxy-L-rhamnonate aldolase RhmA